MKVGTRVLITNPGSTYDTFASWFKFNDMEVPTNWAKTYTPKRNEPAKIVAIGNFNRVRNDIKLYLIEQNNKTYIMNGQGFKLIEEKDIFWNNVKNF